jgi:CubicO group peptidase (beta-lactamase class C family)
MRLLPAVVASLILTLPLHLAAAELPPEVDTYIREEMTRRNLPGVVVTISRDGAIAEKAYGLANVELDVPLTTKHLFPIASTTKPLTSALLLSLVRDGKLQLDDNLGKLLPDVPENWREVTVRQLMSHTSGLPDVSVSPGSADLIATTRDEAFTKLRTMPLQFPRGEKWMYNQTNYALLQMIAEKLTGTSIETAMAERVFKPAGMTTATYGDSDALVRGRVSLYVIDKGAPAPRRLLFPAFLHTAAGVNATARDLIAFLTSTDRLIAAPLREQA